MKFFLAFTFLLALPDDFFTPFSLYRAHSFALKNDTIVSALHRFLLVSWCEYWSMLCLTWLDFFLRMTKHSKIHSTKESRVVYEAHPLVPPGVSSDPWCWLSQHDAVQEGGGSLILPHGAKCLHRAIDGVCTHTSELLRPSQRETTGTGWDLGKCLLCFSSLDKTHSIPISTQKFSWGKRSS